VNAKGDLSLRCRYTCRLVARSKAAFYSKVSPEEHLREAALIPICERLFSLGAANSRAAPTYQCDSI